ncbi:hypothetical protein PEX1_023230 [Penicillium expansum]|uniref:Uncharacterized protein n=1 Tax=Penicillium expansum TaxID=27334 RepID=A0A0A2JT02_PENEN|nr:hypothetical protein PEX2_041010 [Penicillium expansum]KGO45759.1 hypothetical protein PEXP_018820 [Penicillium expansum]KGO57971.1 hypothetical protein PEX2_041010 [Penicillium expansum]KGO72220.1 hypothetical protein PEX1_023230 [Penicillium expansum]
MLPLGSVHDTPLKCLRTLYVHLLGIDEATHGRNENPAFLRELLSGLQILQSHFPQLLLVLPGRPFPFSISSEVVTHPIIGSHAVHVV